jgi:oligosaccharyltransferase complex subunit epsilon
MARKNPTKQASSTETVQPATSSFTSSTTASSSSLHKQTEVQKIVQHVWDNYVEKTPQRVKLIDAFMAFLVIVGGLQFVYCVIGGNYVCIHKTSESTAD